MTNSQVKLNNGIIIVLAILAGFHVRVVEAVEDVGSKIFADWVCDFGLKRGIPYADLSKIGQYRAREIHCRKYGSIRGCKWSDPNSKVEWGEMRPVEEMSCQIRRYTEKEYILCKRYMQCPK